MLKATVVECAEGTDFPVTKKPLVIPDAYLMRDAMQEKTLAAGYDLLERRYAIRPLQQS